MAFVMTSGPAVEPVSLSEAKNYLRVDHDDEDILIASLITAARMHIEIATDQAMITQSWSYYLDQWPEDLHVDVSLGPIQTVDEIRLYASDDTMAVYAAENYFADLASKPGRIIRRAGLSWPKPGRVANGIEVVLTTGYGDNAGDVPDALKQAIFLLLAHWYETRAVVSIGSNVAQIPETAAHLIAPYKMVRL